MTAAPRRTETIYESNPPELVVSSIRVTVNNLATSKHRNVRERSDTLLREQKNIIKHLSD